MTRPPLLPGLVDGSAWALPGLVADLWCRGAALLGSSAAWNLLLFGGVLLLAAWSGAVLARRRARRLLQELCESASRVTPERPGQRVRTESPSGELGGLVKTLDAMLERYESAIHSHAYYATNVAHELKSPLAALLTEVQVSRLVAKGSEEQGAFLGRLEEELERLADIVGSFLVLASVEAGERHVEVVSLEDVVRAAVRRCARAAEERDIDIRMTTMDAEGEEGVAFVYGDPQLLQAMVENLLRNALRFSPAGSAVRIGAGSSHEASVVVVDDLGPGVPGALRKAIFERGVRTNGQAQGTGLGLAIVRSVAALYGGAVEVTSGVGGGARFVVSLPRAKGARPA